MPRKEESETEDFTADRPLLEKTHLRQKLILQQMGANLFEHPSACGLSIRRLRNASLKVSVSSLKTVSRWSPCLRCSRFGPSRSAVVK